MFSHAKLTALLSGCAIFVFASQAHAQTAAQTGAAEAAVGEHVETDR